VGNLAAQVSTLVNTRSYNGLLDDSQQPEIPEWHIHNMALLIMHNRAEGKFGIHLAHAHFTTPENTAMLGVSYVGLEQQRFGT
jgi:hypothetical protein